jgi:hypothetical protein
MSLRIGNFILNSALLKACEKKRLFDCSSVHVVFSFVCDGGLVPELTQVWLK